MRLGIAMLIASTIAAAQEIPAEAQRVLSLAVVKVLNTTRRLPRYTCQETIEREYLSPSKALRQDKDTCPAADRAVLFRTATDRVRLDVAVAEGREINSWPGASRFDSRSIDELVTSGPIGTGSFGTLLKGVFDNPGARIAFAGETAVNGRRVFHYTYTVPITASHYQVKLIGGMWWNTAYSGDFDIGVEAADLTRLNQDTGTLSVDSGMCRAENGIDYHYEKVGEGGFLIPKQARLRTTHPDGSATLSVTTYSACHEYTAESTIRFDDDTGAPSAANVKASEQASAAFAGGLDIVLKLSTPIDTDTAAAGDIESATIAMPVLNRNAKTRFAPEGVKVRGRIVMARHYLSDPHGFDIALAFDRYEMNGVTAPFGAILRVGQMRLGGVPVTLRPVTDGGFTGGGVMSFHTKSARIVVPAGTELKWLTMTPPKAK
jgi:hypothetical protein